jgi:hypothetical protein
VCGRVHPPIFGKEINGKFKVVLMKINNRISL